MAAGAEVAGVEEAGKGSTGSTSSLSANAARRELASRRIVETMSQLQRELAESFLTESGFADREKTTPSGSGSLSSGDSSGVHHGVNSAKNTGWGDRSGAVMMRPGETHPTNRLSALLRGPSNSLRSASSGQGGAATWASNCSSSGKRDVDEGEEEARKWLYNGPESSSTASSSSSAQAEAQVWLSWVYGLSAEVQGLLAPHRLRQALGGSTSAADAGATTGTNAEPSRPAAAQAEYFVGQVVSHAKVCKMTSIT